MILYFFIMSFTYFTYNLFTFLLPIYHQAISICIHIELLLLSEFNLLDDRCLLIFINIFELLLTRGIKILQYIALTSTITLDLFLRLTPYFNSFGRYCLFYSYSCYPANSACVVIRAFLKNKCGTDAT